MKIPPVTICRPDEFLSRRILNCPICECRRRFVVRETAWHGVTTTCCSCGDSWSNGELQPRSASRGWRKKAAAEATAAWNAAGPYDPGTHEAWLKAAA